MAVDQLDLTVQPGEFVTLLGPSGSGKTTTMMMVAGFEEHTAGTVLIDGQPVDTLPPRDRNLGVVFQNYALFPHMSALENVEFALRMRKVPRAERRQRAEDALDRVGLGKMGDRKPRQLSGGQQQRVALARALVFNPAALLLDEPMAALDKRLREQMQEEIKTLQKSLGISVLFVTHDQDEAMAMSDRIVVMRDGKIVQSGPPEEVYNHPLPTGWPASSATPTSFPAPSWSATARKPWSISAGWAAHGSATAGPRARTTPSPSVRSTSNSVPQLRPATAAPQRWCPPRTWAPRSATG